MLLAIATAGEGILPANQSFAFGRWDALVLEYKIPSDRPWRPLLFLKRHGFDYCNARWGWK